jgi:hypothetical protein
MGGMAWARMVHRRGHVRGECANSCALHENRRAPREPDRGFLVPALASKYAYAQLNLGPRAIRSLLESLLLWVLIQAVFRGPPQLPCPASFVPMADGGSSHRLAGGRRVTPGPCALSAAGHFSSPRHVQLPAHQINERTLAYQPIAPSPLLLSLVLALPGHGRRQQKLRRWLRTAATAVIKPPPCPGAKQYRANVPSVRWEMQEASKRPGAWPLQCNACIPTKASKGPNQLVTGGLV